MKRETMVLLEGVITDNLIRLKNSRYGLEESEREALVKETNILMERMTESQKMTNQIFENERKRELENKTQESNASIENRKIVHSWIETATKIVVTGVTLAAYGYFQYRVLDFEQSGKVNSSAGRWLGLPKVF